MTCNVIFWNCYPSRYLDRKSKPQFCLFSVFWMLLPENALNDGSFLTQCIFQKMEKRQNYGLDFVSRQHAGWWFQNFPFLKLTCESIKKTAPIWKSQLLSLSTSWRITVKCVYSSICPGQSEIILIHLCVGPCKVYVGWIPRRGWFLKCSQRFYFNSFPG